MRVNGSSWVNEMDKFYSPESLIFINSPSIYSCKLPKGRWLNLALAYQLEVREEQAILYWINKEISIYNDEEAQVIIEAWEEAHQKIHQMQNKSL
jgi:hypothetical protein